MRRLLFMKLTTDRPCSTPEKAARRIMEHVRLIRSTSTGQVPRSDRWHWRTGGTGWMVHNGERKWPALLATGLAGKLTKEQAEQLKQG